MFLKNFNLSFPMSTLNWNEFFFGKIIISFEARLQFTFFTWNDVGTPHVLAVCMFCFCPFVKARWLCGWVRTYLVVSEETEYLCCFLSCVRTPQSASVQTVVLTCMDFGKINSESLRIHYTCSCLGGHLPVRHPGIDHCCVNQVIENSKLPFFWISS